jgi:uncharacterized phage-like protein YoqJ
MALGWDLAFARASVELGIPLIAAVPFEGQEAMWSPESQAKYRALLAEAETVHVVSPGAYRPAQNAASQ